MIRKLKKEIQPSYHKTHLIFFLITFWLTLTLSKEFTVAFEPNKNGNDTETNAMPECTNGEQVGYQQNCLDAVSQCLKACETIEAKCLKPLLSPTSHQQNEDQHPNICRCPDGMFRVAHEAATNKSTDYCSKIQKGSVVTNEPEEEDDEDLNDNSSSTSATEILSAPAEGKGQGEKEREEYAKKSHVAWIVGGITAFMFVLIIAFLVRKRLTGVFQRNRQRSQPVAQNDHDNY